MYIPAPFRVSDERTIWSFLEQFDFATLVTSSASDGLVVTHLPILVKRVDGGAILQGHVARANPHWQCFDGDSNSVAIFQGPHAYISPSWYATGPAVPTWNYAVVHAHGRPRVTDDPRVVSDILRALVDKYEHHRPRPYRIEDLPEAFYQRMARGIVAFEMAIDRVEAQFKLGQNRSREDQARLRDGLAAEGSPNGVALVAFMREYGSAG